MMKLVLTGSHGTLGQALMTTLHQQGHEVVVWDRRLFPPSMPELYERWLRGLKPNGIIHTAIPSTPTGVADEDHLVSVTWTENLARLSEEMNARLVYTSSVMVFAGPGEQGPFPVTREPSSPHPWGKSKLAAEHALRKYASQVTIARLGWQIALAAQGNHMIAHFREQHAANNSIRANVNWKPACSFVEDTAQALERLLHQDPVVTHIDSNLGWSLADIAMAINVDFSMRWKIEAHYGEILDHRLSDPNSRIGSLAVHLPSLAEDV